MINWLIAKLMPSKVTDIFGATKSFLSGKKTYLAGAALLLQALLTIVEQFCGLGGLADFAGWLKNIAGNGAVSQLGLSLGMLGLRAAVAKTGTK